VSFDVEDGPLGFKSHGFATNANFHTKRTTLLLFINHRAVESAAIKKAVEQVYSGFLPKGGHPFIYLSLEIRPNLVDVNVHPTKRQVNFLHEEEIIEKICGEIRDKLVRVDTSRTFKTQTLLAEPRTSSRALNRDAAPETEGHNPRASMLKAKSASSASGPSPKPHGPGLVRTDAKTRKITSMLSRSEGDISLKDGQTPIANDESMELAKENHYEYTDRQPILCKLASVKELRAEVRDAMHNGLTEIFAAHTFVGIVDERRRIAAIQSGIKLYLVDYGMIWLVQTSQIPSEESWAKNRKQRVFLPDWTH
jgi:DNA mismatch repair protein MLH1